MAATQRKPATKRTMQFYPTAKLLFIDEGKKSSGYIVEKDDNGTVFLEKADGERYVIRSGSCTCKGYQRHRHCKHADAITKLQQLSKLAKPVFTVGEHPHCDFQDP